MDPGVVAATSSRGRDSGLPWAWVHNITQEINLLPCICKYPFSFFFFFFLPTLPFKTGIYCYWTLFVWLLMREDSMEEEEILSSTQPCTESHVQPPCGKDMCTALFSRKQSQNGGNFFTSDCHTALQMPGSLPLLAYCRGLPLHTFSWLFVLFSLLVLWWLLCTAGKRLPGNIHLLALRSRNTSTAFKQCFHWFLQHLMWSHSEKELLTSLHCHSCIIYCLYTLQSVHALCSWILRIFWWWSFTVTSSEFKIGACLKPSCSICNSSLTLVSPIL